MNSKPWLLICILELSLVLLFADVVAAPARQIYPDKKRTMEIQTALIANGYISGSPSGKWDKATIESLKNIAALHHWQTRHVPDARVLILLGLSKGDPEVTKHFSHLDYNKGI